MAESPDTPVFADRYRFEPVGNDWDRGRSGFTHLVYDLEAERLGVIKRAEISSRRAVEGLENEVEALRALKGLGVPEVYDTGQAIYGSKNYFYMVMEYIDGLRIEKKLDSLNVSERAEILTKFFSLLAQAHRRGIVNGDVDLKHLFWRRDKKQLVVIDWGNTKLDVDPAKKTEFAYDLARSAEIIFSLVAPQGHPSAAGSVALPGDSALVHGLTPLPVEFRNLCKWAPRTPSDGAEAPHPASELFAASKKWLNAINKSSIPVWKMVGCALLSIIAVLVVAVFAFNRYPAFLPSFLAYSTATSTSAELSPSIPSNTLSLTEITLPSTATPAEVIVPTEVRTETPTLAPAPSPPITYSPILAFDNNLLPIDIRECRRNETDSPLALAEKEGFYRTYKSGVEDWWGFGIGINRAIDQPIRADFKGCFKDQQVNGMALNASVIHFEPERGDAPGREFGFFLEGQNGEKREYTLWVDRNEEMHLRVRENNDVTADYKVLIVSAFEHGGDHYRPYIKFPIQIFLEIGSQGLDILYLLEGQDKFVYAKDLNPGQMIPIDQAVRPTLGTVKKIGLVGYGGETDVLIWPLVFFSK